MKRIIPLLIALSLVAVSCDKHTDERAMLHDRLNGMKYDLDQINASISAIQSLVTAVQNQDYITDVKDVYQDNVRIGYVIYFLHSDPVTIYNGKDGKDGKDGQDGKDGKNGEDGKDGSLPSIGISRGSDGFWYWTLNGQMLLDDYNYPFPVYGEDAVVPQLNIDNGKWMVSYDDGRTWEMIADSQSGADNVFRDVYWTGSSYVFILSDGSSFEITKYGEVNISFDKPFEFSATPGQEYRVKYSITGISDSFLISASATGGLLVKVPDPYSSEGMIIITVPAVFNGGKVRVFVSHSSNIITKTFVLK